MNPLSPMPSATDVPVPTDRVTNDAPPVSPSARIDDGHVVAMDRGLDWAAMAGITEYESWLRHLR